MKTKNSFLAIVLLIVALVSLVVFAISADKTYEYEIYQLHMLEFDSLMSDGYEFLDSIESDTRKVVVSGSGIIVSTDTYWYENITVDNAKFISDKQAVKQLFADNGIKGVDDYKIVFESSILDGYFLYTEKNGIGYFMPVTSTGNSYGVFENKKVYSATEMHDKCYVEGELFVNQKLIDCDAKPDFNYGDCSVPLRAMMENLGVNVEWDRVNRCATFGHLKLYIDYDEYNLYYLDGSLYSDDGIFYMKNDRIMVHPWFMDIISKEFSVDYFVDNRAYTVSVFDK